MTTTPTTPDLPHPAGAAEVTEWDRIFDVEVLHRFFYGTRRRPVGANCLSACPDRT